MVNCEHSDEFCRRNNCLSKRRGDSKDECAIARMGIRTQARVEPPARNAFEAERAEIIGNSMGYGAAIPFIAHDALGYVIGRDRGPPVAPVAREVAPGAWLLSLDSKARKECAVSRGAMAYFPDAIALVARHSVRMNEKHNPGQPVHWARGKSTDQPDCEARHLIATSVHPDAIDADGAYEMVAKAWRALADLQEWAEKVFARDGRIK